MNGKISSDKPYYAVIFSSQRTRSHGAEYEDLANAMVELAKLQPGFLGIESVRDANGAGITVSYWESLDSIRAWKAHEDHRLAQTMGQSKLYAGYTVRVCKVEREYSFGTAT